MKISAFAAILTSGFINLNDGHSGQKPGSLVACLLVVENKTKSKFDHLNCRYNEFHTHVPSYRLRNIVK